MQRERKEAKVPCSKTKAPAEAGTFQISRCIPHRRKSGSFAVRLDVDLENQRREGRNVGIDLGRGRRLTRIVIVAVAHHDIQKGGLTTIPSVASFMPT